MLYLDSSALVKRYIAERGSDAVGARFRTGERIFTSELSYAEVLAVLGRKYQDREVPKKAYEATRDKFIQDCLFSLNLLEVDTKTMADLPSLVERYPLKGADAVHLSAALWLHHMCRLVPEFAAGDVSLEFGAADRQLVKFAQECGLNVFNPETSI